jgi:hypothetical protein
MVASSTDARTSQTSTKPGASSKVEGLAHTARSHLDQGWPTIPVVGKKGIVEWRPYQERLPTEDELNLWPWQRATGLAMVIGPALWASHPHLWVLDIEAEHRVHAEPWLDAEIPHWRTAGLVVETGGGGLHVYCTASAPLRTSFFAWGECRGGGGICLLPPSAHPDGGRYRWLMRVEPVRWEPSDVPSAEECDRLRFDENSGLIGEGERNHTLFRVGCRYRAGGMTQDEIAAALAAINQYRCHPALDDQEVAKIAASCANYEQGACGDRNAQRRRLRVREVGRA